MAKCDTNPLTKTKHLYYIHSTTGPSHTLNPRRNHNPGGTPSPAPEDSTSQPIPKSGVSRSQAQAKAAISSPKGPGSPPPQPSGDGRSINSKQHVGVRDQPTRRTIHPERSSQRYAHSPAKYNSPPLQGLLRAIEPLWDSTVVTIGQFRSVDDGSGFVLPFIRMVE